MHAAARQYVGGWPCSGITAAATCLTSIDGVEASKLARHLHPWHTAEGPSGSQGQSAEAATVLLTAAAQAGAETGQTFGLAEE